MYQDLSLQGYKSMVWPSSQEDDILEILEYNIMSPWMYKKVTDSEQAEVDLIDETGAHPEGGRESRGELLVIVELYRIPYLG